MPQEDQNKYELVAFSKEEAEKVQAAIDETLKKHGAEIIITNSVQVFKKVLKQAPVEAPVENGVPTPAEFLPTQNESGSESAPIA